MELPDHDVVVAVRTGKKIFFRNPNRWVIFFSSNLQFISGWGDLEQESGWDFWAFPIWEISATAGRPVHWHLLIPLKPLA
jgi:hypothetical protein